jgi:hypothetical protein
MSMKVDPSLTWHSTGHVRYIALGCPKRSQMSYATNGSAINSRLPMLIAI